ncbi:thioesterase II family protein [Streptomyces sp. NPDC048566]|uniref:thioesterase II family protein n=1 Tax=Streptomyces sp. NPDC048566 TaxID=3365569 RepID=UPI00372285B4
MAGTPPVLRLFVLHHAGGSHLSYRRWPAGLPRSWDVRLLDAPGHGMLLDQPRITDAGKLADRLLADIERELTAPYALFGHSMGGLLAYEVTRRIVARRLPLPVWAGISARPAPQFAGLGRTLHTLSDEELRFRLRHLGGTPGAVLDDPDLWALFAPLVRCDLRLVETWRPAADAGPLPVALSAYAGGTDLSAPPARMAGWARHSDRFLGLRVFDGGHFHFDGDPSALLRQIRLDATAALDGAAVRRSGSPAPDHFGAA